MTATKSKKNAAPVCSRRHPTTEARDKAREAYKAKQAAKLEAAQQRVADAADRSPQDQIRRLDERLGVGVGAKKERARLNALID